MPGIKTAKAVFMEVSSEEALSDWVAGGDRAAAAVDEGKVTMDDDALGRS